jgi:hypothetical protein
MHGTFGRNGRSLRVTNLRFMISLDCSPHD